MTGARSFEARWAVVPLGALRILWEGGRWFERLILVNRSVGVVLAICAALGCGKSRVGDAESRWDEPTAANGFHAVGDLACAHACVARDDDGRVAKVAVRTSPEPRVIATLAEPSPELVFAGQDCLAGAARNDWASGWTYCLRPGEGRIDRLADLGPPSAIARMGNKVFVATRDNEGRSIVRNGDVVVAAGERDIRTLATHGADLCWVESNERVRCSVEGSAPRTMAYAPGMDARFLAMDDDAFYVVRGGHIERVERSARVEDAPAERLASASSPVRDVVLVGGSLYWTERGEPRVECLPDGTKPSCSARHRTMRYPFGSLHGVRLADRRSTVVAKDLEDVDGILVAGDFAYASTSRGVVRIPTNGEAPILLSTRAPAIGRPALDPVSWTVYVQTRKRADAPRVVAIEP